jgi:hypothetical protein
VTSYRIPRSVRAIPAILLILVAASCASASGGGLGGSQNTAEPLAVRPDLTWSISTRYQVDFWLHGYAMLQDDTTLVPYFKPGYRDSIVAFKKRGNITTQLDAHRDSLRAMLSGNTQLVGGQFLGLYFRSWDAMQKSLESFLKTSSIPNDGMNRRTIDLDQRSVYAIISASYSTPAAREWLRMFTRALQSEDSTYYASYWRSQQKDRAAIAAAVDTLWVQTYFAKFHGFLTKSGQSRGEILLSIPLDGEGRTLGEPSHGPTIAISFPDSVSRAVDAIYVLAHEVVSTISNKAVDDNVTPAEKRNGVADRYTSPAAVRGGLLLLQKVAPELATGYARYYLNTAHISFTAGEETAAIERAFPLRPVIATQLVNEINKATSN